VQLRHKIRKLVDGRSLASAKKHTLRVLRSNRFPLETKRVIETIDPKRFEQIRRRYAIADPGADWPKYLDLNRWIGVNIKRIRQLELDVARPKQILDLGCGAGYFLYIAQLLGHSGVGLDMDRLPMFREVTRLLGVHRVVQRIEAFRPLPDFGQKFDLITAFMICFNDHKMPGLWGVPEWEFFLDDVAHHLKPRGRIWLELNQEYDESFYTPELKEFFRKRGAKVNEQKVIFNSGVHVRASTSPVAR
jgi:SAM-dependent methyltransferase